MIPVHTLLARDIKQRVTLVLVGWAVGIAVTSIRDPRMAKLVLFAALGRRQYDPRRPSEKCPSLPTDGIIHRVHRPKLLIYARCQWNKVNWSSKTRIITAFHILNVLVRAVNWRLLVEKAQGVQSFSIAAPALYDLFAKWLKCVDQTSQQLVDSGLLATLLHGRSSRYQVRSIFSFFCLHKLCLSGL